MFLLICVIALFPQDLVNRACHVESGGAEIRSVLNGREMMADLNDEASSKDIDFWMASYGSDYTLTITDTLTISQDETLDCNVLVSGDGLLHIINGAKLTLIGCLYEMDDGQVILDNGYLYVPQEYNSQYPHIMYGNSRFEAVSNSEVFANTVYRTVMYDNTEFLSVGTEYPFWNFRQFFDSSQVDISGSDLIGDFTVNDFCQVSYCECDTMLPWFGFTEGDTLLSYSFPDWISVSDYTFSSADISELSGVDYTVHFQNCGGVMWGIESWPGSSAEVFNSFINITLRIMGEGTVDLTGISQFTYYDEFLLSGVSSITDRLLKLTGCYAHQWCIYSYDSINLNIESCYWGESHAKENSTVVAYNSIAYGFPSSVSSVGSGSYCFVNGSCSTFVTAWDNATTLLINSTVVPRSGAMCGTTNYARDQARLLSINSYFQYRPVAYGAAMTMGSALDTDSEYETGDIDIPGSAWVDVGPYCTDNDFAKYELFWAFDGSPDWNLIAESTVEVYEGILAVWNTAEFEPGNYDLHLIVIDQQNDSLVASRDVELCAPTGTGESSIDIETALFQSCPNPFSSSATISYQLSGESDVILRVYDITGREVRTLVNDGIYEGYHSVEWNGKDNSGAAVSPGLYFCRLMTEEGFCQIRKIMFLDY